jgi:threonine dehydrogenase-like Zn-dependent dehydrogenase
MRAVVFHGVADIRTENVPDPKVKEPTDAVVKLTKSAICGTDLHFVRGTFPGLKKGRVLGHEGVGVVEDCGADVRHVREGDRVVIPSTIACGSCHPCRLGLYAQCDRANPNGPTAGTAFFGGPEAAGGFDGLQAERARVPFASFGLVKLPDEVTDDQAILVSDIFPTGWFGARLADVEAGSAVCVFGCGPVGQFAIASAWLQGAGRVLAVDAIPDRLDMARAQGAECIDFSKEDPVEAIQRMTGGAGIDKAIDAVGVDAVAAPSKGPDEAQKKEAKQIAPKAKPRGGNWHPGDAPSQALTWAVESLAKAGTLAIIGVYPPTATTFPIGKAMNKNLTLKMGNCNHRKYIPRLLQLIRMGAIDPTRILTRQEPLSDAVDAYKAFDTRQPGWLKVELQPMQ